MGANYTRQSTYTDGDTISAADTNDEFDQLLAAFAANTGHTHDGTTGEGGPITSLFTNAVTFGTGADTDISITFDANTNDGVITWLEDEDYFQFSDDILMSSTEKVQFGDTASFIQQSSDGVLRIDGEATIDLNASTAVTVSNDLKLDSDAAVLGFGADNDVTLTHVADTALLLNSSRQLQFGDSGTYIHQSADGVLDLVSDTEIEINATTIDMNGAAELSGNLTLGAQLRMPDNTANKILVADGTSFEEKAVGDLTALTSVASGDLLLIVDVDDSNNLKKISRSDLVTGLASGTMTDVVDDTSPQLGGNLDMNGQDIVTTSNANIELAANGTGHVVVKGNTNQGAITLNCENNSHGQKIIAASHSALSSSSGNPSTLTLPSTGDASQELVSTSATQTLTNKTINASQLSGTVANARLDAQLQDVAGLAVTDGGFIVGDGSNFVLETGSTARASIGADNASNISSGTLAAARMAAAQTAITSGLATDLKLGEDDQTKIDFETADEIHFYAANAEQVFVSDGVFGPQTDSDVDLGTTGARFKDAFVDSVTVTGDIAVGDDITVTGRAVGSTLTALTSSDFTDADPDTVSVDMAVGNNFKITTPSSGVGSSALRLDFANETTGQSGNILLDNTNAATISAGDEVAINATALAALSTAGIYQIGYYCVGTGNNQVICTVSGAVT